MERTEVGTACGEAGNRMARGVAGGKAPQPPLPGSGSYAGAVQVAEGRDRGRKNRLRSSDRAVNSRRFGRSGANSQVKREDPPAIKRRTTDCDCEA